MIAPNALRLAVVLALWAAAARAEGDKPIPRPEHPTPDAVRAHWANLNGPWQFRFDPRDEGEKEKWSEPTARGFDQKITVPFGWESELSGIGKTNYRGVAWYRREFTIPGNFPKDDHVWLRFGAVDWKADVWVNGTHVATHEGGYTPFEADVTDALKTGEPNVVTVRAFDPTDPSLPTGKQVGWYTPTSGIWQTVWLESRPKAHIARFVVRSVLDPPTALFAVDLAGVPEGKHSVSIRSEDRAVPVSSTVTGPGADGPDVLRVNLSVPVREAKLWTPETPHLYDVTIELKDKEGKVVDSVQTYFGLRTIARGKYGDGPDERILLNGKPTYLRAALDQSFNPKGIYTAPDDDFLKRDLVIAKQMGLNALRIHIKPDEPRRLYWADKLGVMILEDMPNTWEQNEKARKAWEPTMRAVVARDRNHPAIIAWIAFNETWGLGTPPQYKKDQDTQKWVGRMVSEIRKLDPTRLVEDNSPCNYDHVENTDLNSWHFYIDDHQAARRHIAQVVEDTKVGSGFNYCPGQKQGTAPLINSEYGSVGAGNGDRDVSWGFRDLTTLLRRQPKIQGYVYTELSDIEWEHNGFVNYDRSPKDFGYGAFLPDLTPLELNGADFVGYEGPPAIVARPGEKVTVPIFVSHYSDLKFAPKLRWWVQGWDDKADSIMVVPPESVPAEWKPYGVTTLKPLQFNAPDRPFVGAVLITLRDEQNRRFAGNYVNLVVQPARPLPRTERTGEREMVARFAPDDFARRKWSGPAADPPSGKAAGEGHGFLEYRLRLPEAVVKAGPESFELRFEAGSRAGKAKVDWPSRLSPQDYPQTDTRKWPSTLEISLNGHPVAREALDDDPADARGVLSHLAKSDPGSYGDLVEAQGTIPKAVQADLAAGKPLVLRLAVPEDAQHAGGLSLYGAGTGQFPFDPTLTLKTKRPMPSLLGVPPESPVAVDTFRSRRIAILPAGDAPKGGASWAYTTSDPGPGWSDPDFDPKGWRRGVAGFGSHETPAVKIGTVWDSPDLWLRTTVEAPRIGSDDVLTLHFFHDEDVVVFVNGKRLTEAKGYISNYRDIALDNAQKALFHTGPNTIAVHCRQSQGGQGVDVGLTLSKGE